MTLGIEHLVCSLERALGIPTPHPPCHGAGMERKQPGVGKGLTRDHMHETLHSGGG